MLCCLLALVATPPLGAWLISRRKDLERGRSHHVFVAAMIAVAVAAVCVFAFLVMFAAPETFGPTCKVWMPRPAGWPAL
jgi:ABC-type Mn2+/Zn2+ transport system permease subunit